MRTFNRGVLAALPLALALVLTGCGSDDDGAKVASAGGNKKDSKSDSSQSDKEKQESGVKFARCMRENGVDVEDPQPGKPMRVMGDGSTDLNKAMQACRKYMPQGGPGSPNEDPKAQEQMRKYAQCMRKNGVENFPDPGDGGMRLDNSITGDPDFKKADKACQDIIKRLRNGNVQKKEQG
ncbi:hypothetical protein [Streptomyces sp. NPDC048411]|uniref:hypothetical protein n=1 Tax=Streptomyces sp. NPDC048411 TaxID=3157206 RepID=UPI00345452ED